MEPSQDQHLKTTNNDQMDKIIKEEADDQNGESRQPPDLQTVAELGVKPETSGFTPPLAQSQLGLAPVPHDALLKQEEEPHETHSFVWSYDKNSKNRTCEKAGTIEDSLKGSPEFIKIADRNKNKELVIVRDGKAISSHFPCSLIKDKQLTIKYLKAVDEPKQPPSGSDRCQRKRPSSELVMFHLLTRGGTNVVQMMRNPAIRNDIEEMTVYAYRGEKVKRALKRDGRLLDIIFTKNCALYNTISEVTTEMSNLVDDLGGKTFRIILLDKSIPPDSQPSSLDDAYMTPNESQRSDSEGNRAPLQQSTTAESVNVNTPKQKAGLDGQKAPEIMFREIANSKEMQTCLSSQFTDLVKGKKSQPSRLSRVQNLYRVEYGKNAETCREVKTMKTLMELSNSVCQVRVKGSAEGSGFLLFDKFVLTNGHVLENIYDERTRPLTEKVTVHFSFESLGQEDSGALVEEVAGFELGHVSGHQHDWALLRISADQNSPEGLLKHFGFLPQSGGICIIGHPGGCVKKVDPCFIVPTENFNQVVERHRRENPEGVLPHNPHYSENNAPIQLITPRFFEDVKNEKGNRQTLKYNTCLSFGSSGSPVFDDHCNVVAMHSGGYAYRNARGESCSVLEYGYPLSIIIEHIIVQMVERRMFDVLKKYLACGYKHQQQMMTNLVESRNLSAFRNVDTNDESLKAFFEFFSQREESVPMDTT